MLKKLLTFLIMSVGFCTLHAAEFPQISTGTDIKWYLIKFSEGGFVFDAKSEGELSNEGASGAESQCWKIMGSEADGFTLTNKKGYTLYVDSEAKSQRVKAAVTPGKYSLFKIPETKSTEHPGTFEIQPKGNAQVSMNLDGGVGWRSGKVALWDSKDKSNCVTFVPVEEFETMSKISLIPYPQQLKVLKAGTLNLKTLKSISCADAQMAAPLEEFVAQLRKVSGISLQIVTGAAGIEMTMDKELAAEAYTLQVNDHGIEIKASGTAGFFYALQTLKQLLPTAYFGQQLDSQAVWTVPFLHIEDQPALSHRGFMLDVSRHFFTKEEVMRILDVMSFYKMNIFHWHLTDDQGWRIEIPEYPKLTEIGSIRKASNSSSGFLDDTEYGRGMWYSQQDLKEVVAYAAARNINIIPEVDFPGHMMGAVTAYPELSCDPSKTYELRVWGGISKDVLNVGNDEVIKFLKTVLDNLAKIFPYQYIHFGGDECPTDQWATNELCLKRVREKGLAGVQELQSWLIEELGTYVKTKYDKDIMVWDELTQHWNANNKIKPVVMCWHNNNNVANNLGLHTITCPHDYTYLDMMQIDKNHALIDEPYRGGWNDDKVTTVEKTYSLNPHYKTQGNPYNVLGVQANMWTETTNDNEELEYQVFPRLIATAEVGWLPVSKKDWTSFHQRLQRHDEIWDALGINYAKHYIVPKQLSAKESALQEAQHILENSVKGGVGYPSAAEYEALQSALNAAKVEGADVAPLNTAIAHFKNAVIEKPQAGKMYQIISASTNYKLKFAGASLYQTEKGLRIHYTPQTEPEELWEFVVAADGQYYMQNAGSKQQVTLGAISAAAGLSARGSLIRMDKATKPNSTYTYLPGVVTLSAVEGYGAAEGNVKRLVAQISGEVNVADDAALCNPGTWKLVEVKDFKIQLQGLCKKCESILRKAHPGHLGEPTQEAIDFLRNEVLVPAQADLAQEVTVSVYQQHLAKYDEYVKMPKTQRAKVSDLETAALSGKSFTLTTLRDGLLVVPGGTAMQTLTETNFAVDHLNPNQQFAFVKRGNSYYLYSVREQKFVKKGEGNANVLKADQGDAVTLKAGNPYNYVLSPGKVELRNDRPEAKRILIGGSALTVDYTDAHNHQSKRAVKLLSGWGTGDQQAHIEDGNSFFIETADDFVFEAVKASKLTNGQFGKDMHWYKLYLPNVNLQPHADCVMQSTADGVVDSKLEFNDQENAGQFFAFVSRGPGSYEVYNYAVGPGKVLWSDQPSASNFENHRLSMMPKNDAIAQTWSIEANTNKDANYLGYALSRTDVSNGYISRKGQGIGYWVAEAAVRDPHSCFHFVEVTAGEVAAEAERLKAVPYGAVGSNLYLADPLHQTAFETAYQNFKKDSNNPAYICDLQSQVNAAKAVSGTVAFDANKFYRLQNVKSGAALDVNGSSLVPGTMNSTNANTLWKISAIGGATTLLHANSSQYVSDITRLGAENANFLLTLIEGTTAEFGIHKKTHQGHAEYICHNVPSNAIVGWDTPSAGGDHGWYLIPVTTLDVNMSTIGEKSYASLYLPFAFVLPEGVQAYTGSLDMERQTLTMHLQGSQLPQHTGVVLKGQPGIGSATLTIFDGQLSTLEGNDITGTNVPKEISANDLSYWVLGNHPVSGLGFYHLNHNLLSANKAFIHIETVSGIQGFRLIFDDVTGMEKVEAADSVPSVVYDLSGRCVSKMVKGIYLVNGKKIYRK